MSSEGLLDARVLAELHNALLRLLKEFDRVCTAIGTPYVVYAGTAIGAVRHKGFVPWDDDIDVCMLREDYERFLLEAPDVIGREYALESSRTVAAYPNMFAKLGLKGTAYIPGFIKRSPYVPKVALDIFPFDEIAPTEKEYKQQLRDTWFWGRMMYVQGTPTPYLAFGGLKRHIVHAITGAGYWIMKGLRVTPTSLQRRWEKAARRYEGRGSGRFTDFTSLTPRRDEVTKEDLYPAVEARFGPLKTKLPAEYDRILTSTFGDYMRMPPPGDRKTHSPVHIEIADFGGPL